jgi:hypothetical protein
MPLYWYAIDAQYYNGGASFNPISDACKRVRKAHIRSRISDCGLRILEGRFFCNP